MNLNNDFLSLARRFDNDFLCHFSRSFPNHLESDKIVIHDNPYIIVYLSTWFRSYEYTSLQITGHIDDHEAYLSQV